MTTSFQSPCGIGLIKSIRSWFIPIGLIYLIYLISSHWPKSIFFNLIADASRRVTAEDDSEEGLNIKVNQDTRLDNRILDLRTPTNQAIYRYECFDSQFYLFLKLFKNGFFVHKMSSFTLHLQLWQKRYLHTLTKWALYK